MQLRDGDWIRLDTTPADDEQYNMRTVVTDNGTAGTIEYIMLNVVNGKLYRKRFWLKSSVSGAGEVWFLFRRED